MGGTKPALLVVLLTVLTPGWAVGETDIDITGQVRFRSELQHKSFDVNEDIWYGTNLRTRVNVDAVKDSNAHVFVQFQDSRELGAKDKFGNWQSGTTTDGEGVDVHQAYVEVDRIWTDGLGMKTGRFELNLGNQRVFGNVDWDNVGRSWEGSQVWYQFGPRRLSGFWLVRQAQDDGGTSLFGLHFRCAVANLELFSFFEIAEDTTDSDHINNDDMDRYTYALYWMGQRNQFDLEINGVYQSGQKANNINISAYLFTIEGGFSFGAGGKHRLAAGIDYASGDGNRYDNTDNTYHNLYYTGHKFRGYMDYFVTTETAGLMDVIMRGRFALAPQWTALTDFHYFRTAEAYRDPCVDPVTSRIIETTKVGLEFDFTMNTTSVAGVNVLAGCSVFLPDESFVRRRLYDYSGESKNDPTYWSYAQVAVDF